MKEGAQHNNLEFVETRKIQTKLQDLGKEQQGKAGGRLMKDRFGNKLPDGPALFEHIGESIRCCKSRNGEGQQRDNKPFYRQLRLVAILHTFTVRNIPSSTNNGELSSPDGLCNGENGPVYIGPGIPVSRNQEHILAHMDPRFVDAEGTARPRVLALHVNVTEVCGGFVQRNVRGETDEFSTGPQRSEMITFDESSALDCCVSITTINKGEFWLDVLFDRVVGTVPRA